MDRSHDSSGTREHGLRRQIEAAKTLLLGIRGIALDGSDEDLIADTVEGETDLMEAIDSALAEIDETKVLVTGLKAMEAQYSERRHAMEARIERLRALVEQAMAVCDLTTLRRPAATLTLRKTPPAPVIENEADIPSEFFTPVPQPPPKLDKAALALALKEREIPGARLSNGGLSLSIRRG